MTASLAESTIKQYNTSFRKWWSYCNKNFIPFFTASVSDVTNFLFQEFTAGSRYSTLNAHRSALTIIIPYISQSAVIERYLKGVFKLRPTFPKYSMTWNPDRVLLFLSQLYPLTSITLEQLSYKLITLIALSTAHRLQTLHCIRLSNISHLADRVEIIITDLIKTSTPKKEQPKLILPYYEAKPEICVASTLIHYIEITRTHRKEIDKLFITFKRPFHAASKQTLSRWVRNTLKQSGIDTKKYSPHSVRHASTSAALRAGVSIDTIRTTAGWSKNSNTFFNYYNRSLENANEFAKSVIKC